MLFEEVISLLQEARPIPIDKAGIGNQARRIAQALKYDLEGWNPDTSLRRVLAPGNTEVGISTKNTRGERLDILVRVLARKPQGSQKERASQGGKFWRSKDGTRRIINIYISNEWTAGELLNAFGEAGLSHPENFIRSTLIHELTHAIDPNRDLKRRRREKARAERDAKAGIPVVVDDAYKKKYLNSPREYAAHIQQVVDDITTGLHPRMLARLYPGKTKQQVFQELLKRSNTWTTKSSYFTRAHYNKALSTIYTALRDHLAAFPSS